MKVVKEESTTAEVDTVLCGLQLSNSKSLAICNETAYQSLLRSRKRRFIPNYRKQKRKKSTKINDLHSINTNTTVLLSNEVSIIVSFSHMMTSLKY